MRNQLFTTARACMQAFVVSAITIGVVGCGSTSSSSGNPAAPSAVSLNLAGSWTGKIAGTNGNGPSLVWTASQSGSTVSGPLDLSFVDNGKPQTFRGTLSGTISGADVSLTISIPAGAFADVPACSITATGTATPTATSISSSMTVNFAPACVGTISDRSSEIDQLSLTKS